LLLQFSVKNFRSFAEEQELSMLASKKTELLETNTFQEANMPRLLRSSVIYGPNAGGKSNFVKAMYFLQQYVIHSSTSYQEKQKIPVQSFRLKSSLKSKPSEFSIDFICDGIRFNYQLSINEDQIIKEELYAFPKKRSQTWFTRLWNFSEKKFDWYHGPELKGTNKAWIDMTRSNALYLSTAVQFNCKQLKPVFLWFKEQLVVLLKNNIIQETSFNPNLTFDLLKNPSTRNMILKFMECADLGIEDYKLIEEDNSHMKKVAVQSLHKMIDSEKNIPFDLFADESDGTIRLFSLAGGWLKALREGLVLCVDELDLHLHPNIVRYLVELFQNSKINKKNAQLIFTTHDTSLLDRELFRRDQVWFVQKDKRQMSRLYSLLEFKPRKGEAIGKGYLQGRYGALPFVGNFRYYEK
jgi:uncharacterized protein